MGDEEAEVKLYAYEGERATGETVSITAGEDPKVLTKDVEVLGAREGKGKASYTNGDVYEGEFVAGDRSGTGSYTYAAPVPEEGDDPKPPVASYDGKWTAGAKSGVGVLTFTSGAKYHGSFVDGKYGGLGTMFYANGDIYTGAWVDGKKQGHGTYIFKETGAKASGEWSANQLLAGEFTDKFGNEYSGTFGGDAKGAVYVAGGDFTLCSGAKTTVPKPSKSALLMEMMAFDKNGDGFIDATELKDVLTRPGTGMQAMSDEDAAGFLELFHMLFDKNGDGRISVAELVAGLEAQHM